MLHGINEAQNSEKSAKEAFSNNINRTQIYLLLEDKQKDLKIKLT